MLTVPRFAVLIALSAALCSAPRLCADEAPVTLSSLSLDDGFGTHGRVVGASDRDRAVDEFEFVAIDSQQRIVAAGYRKTSDASPDKAFVAVARYLPDGSPDTSFDYDGVVVLSLTDAPQGFAVDSADRVVLSGTRTRSVSAPVYEIEEQWVARLDPSGLPDASFGAAGVAILPEGFVRSLGKVVVSPADGSILVAAQRYGEFFDTYGLVRVTKDGVFDPSFAGDGFADSPAGSQDGIDFAVDAAGRTIVTAGYWNIIRLLANGAQDATFGTGGRLVGPDGAAVLSGRVLIDAAGRISVFAFGTGVTRFDANGKLDTSFGSGGVVALRPAIPLDATPTGVAGLAVTPDAAARYVVVDEQQFYGPSGRADRRTSGTFVQVVDPAQPSAFASYVGRPRGNEVSALNAVAVVPDGSAAVAVGRTQPGGFRSSSQALVVRVDLEPHDPRVPGDVSVRFVGTPEPFAATKTFRFKGAVRVTSRGSGAYDQTVRFFLSDDATLSPDDQYVDSLWEFTVRAGESRRIAFELPADDGFTHLVADPTGKTLIALIEGDNRAPEADDANNVAVSSPLGGGEPLPEIPPQRALFNEVFFRPGGPLGDANGDGVPSETDDQFVEILNLTDAPLDLTGWRILARGHERYAFPAGAAADARNAVVVFGGGDPAQFAAMGTARVLVAPALGLRFSRTRGDLVLVDETGAVQDTVSWRMKRRADPYLDHSSLARLGDGDPHSTFQLSGVGGTWTPGTRQDRSPFVEPPPPVVTHVALKTLVLNFDPIVEAQGGKRTHEVYGWTDPHVLYDGYVADVATASGGYVSHELVEWVDADDYLVKTDGFVYTDETFASAWASRNLHQPNGNDYTKLIADYRLAERVKSGEIDEVLMFGYPYAGFYESRMAGPGAYACNSPGMPEVDSGRKFVMMGFNYERGVGEMLEDLGHRTEAILTHVYGSWNGANVQHDWDRFTLYDKIAPGQAACGNVHFAPNGVSDYDWGNTTVVTSTCDDWLAWPNLTGVTKQVDRTEWGGGGIREHHVWWLSHLPQVAGVRADGKQQNWWKYVMDFNGYAESR